MTDRIPETPAWRAKGLLEQWREHDFMLYFYCPHPTSPRFPSQNQFDDEIFRAQVIAPRGITEPKPRDCHDHWL